MSPDHSSIPIENNAKQQNQLLDIYLEVIGHRQIWKWTTQLIFTSSRAASTSFKGRFKTY